MKTIISASRRTDIPAFYYDWFQTALKEQKVTTINPLYPEKEYIIDLSPQKVHSIVLWSKDFRKVENDPMYLENYNLYFQYTITGYSKYLEPNIPSYKDSLLTLEKMLKKYKPEQFNIRFDPIILSVNGELSPTPQKPGLARLNMFDTLCKDLVSLGMEQCRITTSFATLYPKVIKRMQEKNINFITLNDKQEILFMEKMSEIAQKYNRNIYTCANDRILNSGIKNIKKGHCIDGDILTSLFGPCTHSKDKGQREECGCVKSKDIGSYLKCFHNCLYCYAN